MAQTTDVQDEDQYGESGGAPVVRQTRLGKSPVLDLWVAGHQDYICTHKLFIFFLIFFFMFFFKMIFAIQTS